MTVRSSRISWVEVGHWRISVDAEPPQNNINFGEGVGS